MESSYDLRSGVQISLEKEPVVPRHTSWTRLICRTRTSSRFVPKGFGESGGEVNCMRIDGGVNGLTYVHLRRIAVLQASGHSIGCVTNPDRSQPP